MSDRKASNEAGSGAHHIRFEPPDVCHITIEGDVSTADTLAMFAEFNQFLQMSRWLLLIVDMTRAGTLSVEARRVAMEMSPRVQGTAIVGASGRLAVVLSLLNKAFNLLRHRRAHMQRIGFFDSETQARAWVAERRRVLASEDAAAAA